MKEIVRCENHSAHQAYTDSFFTKHEKKPGTCLETLHDYNAASNFCISWLTRSLCSLTLFLKPSSYVIIISQIPQ